MKHLIFIGVLFLVGSCSMENHYFSKRIPVLSEKNSPPEFFSREEVAELSVLKPIEEQDLTFELSAPIDSVEVFQSSEKSDTIKKAVPMYGDPNETRHNECRCFAKSLIMSGSMLSVMAVITFFSWTTLGIVALVIGILMIAIGIILKRT